MKNILVIVLITLSFIGFGKNQDSLLVNVESHLITNDIDLAKAEFKKLSNIHGDYLIALNNLFNEVETYSDLRLIIEKIATNYPNELDNIQKLFNLKLDPPNENVINIEYVKLKSLLMLALLEGNELALADEEYVEFEEYIARFTVEDFNYKRSIFYKNIYNVVIEIIKDEIDTGIKLSNENMNIAIELMDTNLMVMSDFYYSDFLIRQNDLDGYIDITLVML